MRSILHPGKPNPSSIQSSPGFVDHCIAVLEPGRSLLQAMVESLAPFQATSAVIRLEGGAFEPFCYVMPALSKSPDHAVYFSERFNVAGRVRLETASVTYGVRKGQPWLHCHAVWVEPDGTRRCGHLLPEDIVVVEPIGADVSVLRNVVFSVEPDLETNFSLFVPIRNLNSINSSPESGEKSLCESGVRAQSVYALRLSPNIDVCEALEKFCQANHIRQATILGGVGSTVGAVFDDGRVVEPFVTEMLIRQGTVRSASDDDRLTAEIDISIVDYLGGISEGRLKRGANPVLVTFELVLSIDQIA